ncbi:MAG: hypothetical protein JXL20_05525 [Deltaproteobacteria bacterium]|nr:hypothetical protein [Deltaproteobacteria bacterium]MBN2783800.1 hypothetical protein [Pontiellaceae bacterium]
MKNHIALTGLVIAIVLIIAGFFVAQGDWPSSTTMSPEGIDLVLGRYTLENTIPGIALMVSGTIIAIASLIKK